MRKQQSSTLIVILFFISISFFSQAQNTPSLWKHTCNCGSSEMIVADSSDNVYVFTDASLNDPHIIKLKPNGQAEFNNTYVPNGYSAMRFTNSFYKNGSLFVAGYADSTSKPDRMFLMQIDTNGILQNQIIVDSVAAYRLSWFKSTPYYSYGFMLDNQDNIHVGFYKQTPSFITSYSFLKFDLSFNLISQYEEVLPFIASTGPFYVNKAGNVFYSYTGTLNKLDNNYTAIQWSHSFGNYSTTKMISEDSSGNPIFIQTDPNVFPAPVTYLVKLIDNGSSYSLGYNQSVDSSQSNLYHLVSDTVNNYLYLSGTNNSTFPYRRYVSKYDAANANFKWIDSTMDGQFITDMILDNDQNLIVTGGGTDYHVWFYDSLGYNFANIIYDGPCGANDMAMAQAIINNNYIILTGSACENASNISYATTLKYINPNSVVGTNEFDISLNEAVFFPNPATDIIHFTKSAIKIEVMDVAGRNISFSKIDPTTIDISTLSSGVYFLKMINKDKTIAVGKFVKQ